MRRDQWIALLLCVQSSSLLLGGAWPILDIRSFEVFIGTRTDHLFMKAFGGILIFIGVALAWCAYRGVIEGPLRLIAAGTALILGSLTLAGATPDEFLHWIVGVVNLIFAACWVILLLTSDSPYRPRPVTTARHMKQRT